MDYFDGFSVSWASDGQVADWSQDQYRMGWATIGDSKPSVEQFNAIHKQADDKTNWLYRQLAHTAAARSVGIAKADQDVLTRILQTQLEAIYPVGSVYINANSDTNPGTFLPGTWVKLTSGFLYPHGAAGSGAVGSTGGATTHQLSINEMPSHTHGATASNAGNHSHTGNTTQGGAHSHTYRDDYTLERQQEWVGQTLGIREILPNSYKGIGKMDTDNNSLWYQMRETEPTGTHGHNISTNLAGAHGHDVTVTATGSGSAHNNMPPYLTVFMFKRTV